MKKQSFILSALILALGGFFAKAIGAIYKIPLANILGSSGMGIYYLIFPVYSLLISISSGGISIALATEVAKCRKIKHKYNEQMLLRVALVLSFAISTIFMIIVLFIAKPLAELQGNVNGFLGYIIISPAIIISSLIATLRGYFQGIENMIPTTVSMIIEQIVKLSVGLVLAHMLCSKGVEYAVIGAILGVTLSEVVAFVIIAINFFSYKGQLDYNYRNLNYKKRSKFFVKEKLKSKNKLITKKGKCDKITYLKCNDSSYRYSIKQSLTKIIKVALPATFSSLIIPIATMLDSFMIINLLLDSGYSSLISTSLYGIWGGIVQSFISLPIILIAGVSTSLVPSLSGLVAKNDTNEIKDKVTFYIKLTWILSIIIFVLVYMFAGDILEFLYGDGLSKDVIDEMYYATKMLKLSSISIIYYAFLQTFISILQSIGKSFIPFVSLLIAMVVRTGLLIVLVSTIYINIYGCIIANTIFLALACLICVCFIKKWIKLEYNLWRHLLNPVLIGCLILGITYILDWALKPLLNYFFSMVISGIVAVVAYGFIIFWSKTFTNKELKFLKIKTRKITKSK